MAGPHRDNPHAPVMLPGYAVRGRFEAGGMSEVLVAERVERPGEPVVIKRLLPHLGTDDAIGALFAHEIRVMRRLAHRAVPTVIDDGADARGTPFLVLEHVDGIPLARLIERGVRLSLSAWSVLADELLDALAHVHAQTDATGQRLDIVHRDVNPANVLLTARGEVKLIDFGIASSAGRRPDAADADRGTPGYVAPEVLTTEADGDARADLFCAGIVLYESAAGARLFGGNRFAAMSSIVEGSVSPLSERRPEFAPFDAALLRALARQPTDRWPTAEALQTELRRIAASIGCRAEPSALADVVRASS